MKNSSRTFFAIAIVASFGCSGNSRSSSGSTGEPTNPPPEPPVVDPLRPGQSLICDMPATDGGEADAAVYVLSAMNHKLEHYPDFARALGVSLVSDCETARRFVIGYADYSREHPDFDADEPLPPSLDDEPELPPDEPDEDSDVSKVAGSPAATNNPVVRIEFRTCAKKGCPSADSSWNVNGQELRRSTFTCSGTFISKNWILTAAHCMTFSAIDRCMEEGLSRTACPPNWDHWGSWRIQGTISTSLGADGYASADDTPAPYDVRVQARTYVISAFPGTALSQNPYTCTAPGCYDGPLTANNDLALLYIHDRQDHKLPPRVEDGAAKRLSITEPNPAWTLSLAGWGSPLPLTLRQTNQSLGTMVTPVPGERIDMVTSGPAYPCPGDSGGPLMRTGLDMRTNRGIVERGVEAIIGVWSSGQANCNGGPEPSPLFWRATRVNTKKHRDFITEKMHRWPHLQAFQCIQRDLDPPTGQNQVQECWGKGCSIDGAPCTTSEVCRQPKRVVEKQAAGICVRCADFPSGSTDHAGCNCVEGQCLPKNP